MRSIYRPNNLYCVHVDKKASAEFRADVRLLASCIGSSGNNNVFLVSRPVDVHYSHYSRVQADLNCLQDLKER